MSGNIEALAEILHHRFDGTGTYCPWQSMNMCPGYHAACEAARAILASDWLARHDAEVGAAALRQGKVEGYDAACEHDIADCRTPGTCNYNPYRADSLTNRAREGTGVVGVADMTARIEAALRLIAPDHITPTGIRQIQAALRADSLAASGEPGGAR